MEDHWRIVTHNACTITEIPFENFVFAGLIPRERIPEMISAMDIVVHTSLREGLPRVLPQSLAMGKPCVSFDIDGAPEVVINGKTGYLIETYDKERLVKAISNLFDNPDLIKEMGENGRQHVDPAFRAETMVKQIAEVYEMLLVRLADRIDKFNETNPPKWSNGLESVK